jgi:hypothetical protein
VKDGASPFGVSSRAYQAFEPRIGQSFEHAPHDDSKPSNAGLTVQLRRIDGDPVEARHPQRIAHRRLCGVRWDGQIAQMAATACAMAAIAAR